MSISIALNCSVRENPSRKLLCRVLMMCSPLHTPPWIWNSHPSPNPHRTRAGRSKKGTQGAASQPDLASKLDYTVQSIARDDSWQHITDMNGGQPPEAHKPPPASGAGANGHNNNNNLAAKKRKKDGLKPIITTEGAGLHPMGYVWYFLASLAYPLRCLPCFASSNFP